MKKVVSFITAGHAPREDIVEELGTHLSKEIMIRQKGALDHLSAKEVKRELEPMNGEPVITSRILDKTMMNLSKAKVMPLLQRAVDGECRDGADVIVLLCTNAFDRLHSRVPMIIPYQLLRGVVTAVQSDCKTGALFPYADYAGQMEENWRKSGVQVAYKCASPMEKCFHRYTEFFREEAVEMLILDCIGYTYECRDFFSRELGITVVHPRTVIVNVIHSLLCLDKC